LQLEDVDADSSHTTNLISIKNARKREMKNKFGDFLEGVFSYEKENAISVRYREYISGVVVSALLMRSISLP